MKNLIVKSLTSQFIAITTIIITIILLLFSLFQAIYIKTSMEHELKNKINQYELNLRTSLKYPVWNVYYETINDILSSVMNAEEILGLIVYSEDYKIILSSKLKITVSNLQFDDVQKYIKTNNLLFRHFPIEKKGAQGKNRIVGHCTMIYSDAKIIKTIFFTLGVLFIIFMLIITMLIISISIATKKLVLNPLVFLTNHIKKISQGQELTSLSNEEFFERTHHKQDEITILHTVFYDMISKLNMREQERNEVEFRLKQTKNFLHNVINSMTSMLISIDSKGIITQWNEAAAIYTGIPFPEALDRNIWQINPGFDILKDHYKEVIETDEVKILRRIKLKARDDKYYNVYFYPLTSKGIDGVVMRLDDVTEVEKKEEQLKQSQKMELIGTLAGGLAHDFNNVLSGITGGLSLINYKLAGKDQINPNILVEYLDIMDKSAIRATEIVRQLLTLSRKKNIEFSAVDINSSIKHVLNICQNTFDKCIEITQQPFHEPAIIKADPSQFEQVLLNLCVNASHAMTIMRKKDEARGGTLLVSVEEIFIDKVIKSMHPEAKEAHYWLIKIKDSGIGIDKQTKTKIFEPFFTTKKKGQGTGLGLSMVYNIIHAHHGFIDLYSEVGIGTSFNIYLPKFHIQLPENVAVDTCKIYKGDGLILIVDDEEVMRQIASAILSECGYELLFAENGEEAISIFNKKHDTITAVLLDMIMPKMSGKETFYEMKKIDPKVKVILGSGFRQDENVELILNDGVKAFIQKPYSMQKLSKIMYEIIYDKLD